jgi:hypothetical protein
LREVKWTILIVTSRYLIVKVGATSSSASNSSETVIEVAVTELITGTAGGIKVITAASRFTTASTSSGGVAVAKDCHLQLVQPFH